MSLKVKIQLIKLEYLYKELNLYLISLITTKCKFEKNYNKFLPKLTKKKFQKLYSLSNRKIKVYLFDALNNDNLSEHPRAINKA